ncbi:hypothetical protein BGZ90_004384 [Linnemannia elongata]|nr:hypothetical protein BGZ90_004384 [Linnemannia elongata]
MGQGVPKDCDKAMEWYRQAADQGLPAAQLKIGYMYLTGRGVAQDKDIALEWFSKAASRKDTDIWSQMAMGLMSKHGLGVPKSDSTAFPWFLKAAQQGFPDAQYFVGVMYRNGEGVSEHSSNAMFWFLKSANHNYLDAQDDVGTMYYQDLDYLKAENWYAKAANLGHEGAKSNLLKLQMMTKASKCKPDFFCSFTMRSKLKRLMAHSPPTDTVKVL